MNLHEDTITAIATPIGEGGIAVIRISGCSAIEIADRHFRGKNSIRDVASHTAHFGHFAGEMERTIDEVVVTVFRGPHSYTAEDVVEVSCHGGRDVSPGIPHSLVSSGGGFGEAGEFTQRAFLTGRINLSTAQAAPAPI